MIIRCQYKNGMWITYTFKRVDLTNTSFRLDEERPVKIVAKISNKLTKDEIKYLISLVDYRSDNKLIQE